MSVSADDQYKTSTTDSTSTNANDEGDIDNKEQTQQLLETEHLKEIVIKTPDDNNNNNVNNDLDPGPVTKQKLVAIMIVLFSMFLDFMGVSIVQPILPFYAEMFGATSTELGALYSSYSAMSLLASFGMGKFSDNLGRKPMILFSLFGTCVGFLATGLAQNYGQLLAFRFLTGFFGATAPVAMAVITDTVPAVSRPKYLAATGAVIMLAFVAGPGLGSGLAEFGIRVPFFVSSGLGAFGFVFALIFLKETNPTVLKKRLLKKQAKMMREKRDNLTTNSIEHEQDEMEEELQNLSSKNDEKDVNNERKDGLDEMDNIKIVTKPIEDRTDDNDQTNGKIPIQVWVLCIVNTSTAMGFTVYASMFALYMIDLYDLNSLDIGYITLSLALTMVFGNVIFVQGSKYIGMYKTSVIACFLFGIALLIVPFINNVWGVISVVVFGMGLGYGAILPAMNACVASFTNAKNRGIILGLASVFQNIALIIGPMLHGILYGYNKSIPFWVGSCTVMIGGIILIIMMCKWPELRNPPKKETILPRDMDGENWKYVPDKITRKDYMRLGKAFGVMLSQKKYRWKTHFDKLLSLLDTMFPPLRTDSEENLREDIEFVLTNAKEVRMEFDNLRFTPVKI